MSNNVLPNIKDVSLELPHFPTRMQAVIFRLWEMVPVERLAQLLNTDVDVVIQLANDMSLPAQKNVEEWVEKGYISIIRSMWYLLPYEQIMEILGWDKAKLAYTLKEDDFLDIKLGQYKPSCEKVVYKPLTELEIKRTRKINNIMDRYVRSYDKEDMAIPFNFFPKTSGNHLNSNIPEGYDVVLDESWKILDIGGCCDEYIKEFIDDFNHEFGVKLCHKKYRSEIEMKNSIVIELYDWNENEEYHEVIIGTHQIKINAVSLIGVFRGLVLLESLASQASGPYFKKKTYKRKPCFENRFIYSYCGIYGDAFDANTEYTHSDELLKAYAKVGVNGIWIQAVLYKLTPFPYDPSLSIGWEDRIHVLNSLIERAKKFGIKVFLYINEPRSMPLSFFEKYPNLRGHVFDSNACMCTSSPEVQTYLIDAIKTLCKEAPDLGGLFTITRSENHTNCYSHVSSKAEQDCPRCKNKEPYEVISSVNSLISKTVNEVNPKMQVYSWTWSWNPMGDDNVKKCIEQLDTNMTLMCTSEEHLDYKVGDKKLNLRDYTMSRVGPSEQSKLYWRYAKESNHRIAAKIQINSTWEASTAPYIPVYENIYNHMSQLQKLEIDDLMLSWTLGGYPSENLKFASAFFFQDLYCEEVSYNNMLKSIYGEEAPIIKDAVSKFGEAFANFPFYVDTVYLGPHNGGPSNLLYAKPTGLKATMTCYAFDDLDGWRSVFSTELYKDCFEKLSIGWNEGVKILEKIKNCELKDVAQLIGILFQSSYNQICFILERDQDLKNKNINKKKQLVSILEFERELAIDTYRLMLKYSTIGYEAANHYYFNRTMIMEKILNCTYLIERYQNDILGKEDNF